MISAEQQFLRIDDAPVSPVADSLPGDAQFAGPLSHCHRSTAPSDCDAIPLVVGLLGGRRPPAVLRGVRSIIVDPVNGMFRGRSRAHVFVERLEATRPPLANRNPATPVSGVRCQVGVCASSSHLPPDAVLGRRGQAMCPVQRGAVFNAHTPAGLLPALQVVADGNRGFPAVATAKPRDLLRRVGAVPFEHDKTAEALSGKIDESGHVSMDFTPLLTP